MEEKIELLESKLKALDILLEEKDKVIVRLQKEIVCLQEENKKLKPDGVDDPETLKDDVEYGRQLARSVSGTILSDTEKR